MLNGVGEEVEEEGGGGVRDHPHGPSPEQDGPALQLCSWQVHLSWKSIKSVYLQKIRENLLFKIDQKCKNSGLSYQNLLSPPDYRIYNSPK